MARDYKSASIKIGDRILDRVITGIDPAEFLKHTYYHYRCDCGAKGKIQRQPLLRRQKDGITGCSKCAKPRNKSLQYGYQQAVENMEFVNKYWK